MKPQALLVIAAALALAPLAQVAANDSTAEHGAGGLVLKQSREIDMVSEDLYVSAERVRVRYVFRNRSPGDVSTTVAFPMPDRDLAEDRYGDSAYPGDFSTRVDGRPVAMAVERRAVLGGTDHTALLQRLGVPLAPDEEGTGRIVAALAALPPAERERLRALRLVEVDEYDAGRGWQRDAVPAWTVRESWYWQQVFPAGRDLRIEHDYAPGTGGSVDVALARPDYRNSAEGRAEQADYCTDRAFLAALDRAGRSGRAMTERRLRYILTTGGNWRSPIGDFRLVVDKGRAENIVSFCGTGLRRISPTQFEMRRRNWRPDRDLAVLIVQRSGRD
ncbi:MAG TPA: DUF4424 domain-containing protein [Allosphingosinicella sp.]|jgi:hypothetical protein